MQQDVPVKGRKASKECVPTRSVGTRATGDLRPATNGRPAVSVSAGSGDPRTATSTSMHLVTTLCVVTDILDASRPRASITGCATRCSGQGTRSAPRVHSHAKRGSECKPSTPWTPIREYFETTSRVPGDICRLGSFGELYGLCKDNGLDILIRLYFGAYWKTFCIA